MLDGSLIEAEWKKNFRMPKLQFDGLLEGLVPYITPKNNSPNYHAVSAKKKLAMTLYYLKDTGTLRMTANSFGMHVSTASKIIHEVCRAISQVLGPMNIKCSRFEAKYGMPPAFGCIDGTHIPIKRPTENSQDFFCYKMFYSLHARCICDFSGMFMDIDCRWPGSINDAKVFANSVVNQKLRDRLLPLTYQELIPG